jgi:hypothetical protein
LQQGSIHGRAYCHPRDSYGAAIAAIKADLSRSLAARFEFLCEELERRESDLKESKKKTAGSSSTCAVCACRACVAWRSISPHLCVAIRFRAFTGTLFNPFGEGKQAPKFDQRWGLPQRVFFPFVKPLLLADYLMPFETVRVR